MKLYKVNLQLIMFNCIKLEKLGFIFLIFIYKYLMQFFSLFSFSLFLKILSRKLKLVDDFVQYEWEVFSSYLIISAFKQYLADQ